MRQNDLKAEHSCESNFCHSVCIEWRTLCSRSKEIFHVEWYSALAAPAMLMKLARPLMRRNDLEAQYLFERHLSHFICIGWWTLCSRPKGILDVEWHLALAAPARLMKLAQPYIRRNDPEAEHLFESHLCHFLCISQRTLCSRPNGILDVE